MALLKTEMNRRASYALKRTPVHRFLMLLEQSTWRPFRAQSGLGRFPGLKPRAESCSPFGAKTHSILDCHFFPGESTAIFVTLPFRATKHPKSFPPFCAMLDVLCSDC
jgi:hypothetical protein